MSYLRHCAYGRIANTGLHLSSGTAVPKQQVQQLLLFALLLGPLPLPWSLLASGMAAPSTVVTSLTKLAARATVATVAALAAPGEGGSCLRQLH